MTTETTMQPSPAAQPVKEALLILNNVTKRFGGLVATNQLDLQINRGEIFSLIGPNGAGKSTVFNLITGIYRPSTGTIRLGDRSVIGLKPYHIARAGIARTFQNIRLFSNALVWENIAIAANLRSHANFLDALFRTPRFRAEERALREKSLEWLNFVGLEPRWASVAKNLPYGQQRRLEIARALATDPQILLLDEPAAGMNPQEKESLMALIGRIRDRGVTVLLIEHDMSLVMRISDRVSVMNFGTKIAEGLPSEVQKNPQVIEAYLGTDE